jgi:GDPmannose 4,6-dehydratase
MPAALIIGNAGQDGIYLSRLLRAKGYRVLGIDHRTRLGEADAVYAIDLQDGAAVREVLVESAVNEVYYLAAFHHSSEQKPSPDVDLLAKSFQVNTLALNTVLGAVCAARPAARVLYASSNRIFGDPKSPIQNEETPQNPIDAYGISKGAGMEVIRYWRRARQIFAVSAILYNHESPLRPPQFLSQKIVLAALDASRGTLAQLRLGHLAASVDWGHAADTVRAMWLMLQQSEPQDYVVATGMLHTVGDWLEKAFGMVGAEWKPFVVEDPAMLASTRPNAVLCGDSSRLRHETGWRPEFDFPMLVHDMVHNALSRQRLVSRK